jgi:antitoxin component of MazEF toxin-antitoxin module
MFTKIIPIGNSQGIRIPKLLLSESELGDEVRLVVKKGEIRILKVSRKSKNRISETILLSEKTLAADWERPDEETAWKNLQ